MDLSILADLGLTPAEIKIYLALLELGSSKAGPIIRKSGLQNSVVHLTLNKLVERGFASFVKKGKIKHYQATDPRNILRYIDERRSRMETLLPELLKVQRTERQEAEVFEGYAGFRSMCYKLIEDAQPGDEYLFFAFWSQNHEHDDMINRFYQEFKKDRERRGLIIKGIAHIGTKPYFITHNRPLDDIVFVDTPILQNTSICNSKVIFTPWRDEQVAFLVTSRQLAENLREYFYSIYPDTSQGSTKIHTR